MNKSGFGLYNLIVWSVVIIFAVVFTVLALNRHAAFESNGFDLGNVNQAIWNTAQGRPFAFTNMAPLTNRLALHVEPILFLFVPFYWLGVDGPKFLLAVQALIVALGAWPLYLIARPKIGASGAAAISAAYLLYPALEAAVMFDFHAVTLAPTFLLFAFYYLEKAFSGQLSVISSQRSAISFHPSSFILHPSIPFLLLTLSCKEDMGFVVAMLGVYFGLRYKRWKPAALIFALGTLWSLTAILLVQPMFAVGGNIQGARYAWLADVSGNPQLLLTHLQQVNLPDYLWRLFAPVAGLSLLSPLALLPILPSLAINLLSSHPLTWRAEEFHYVAPIAPFIFIAAVLSLQRISDWRQGERERGRKGEGGKKPLFTIHYSLFTILLLASLSYHFFRGFTPLARPFRWRSVAAHQQLGAEMAANIDPALPLFAPLNLNPHVSSRAILHQDFDDIAPDDWLWLDVASLPNENNIQQHIRDDLLSNYKVISARDGYLLLQPNRNSQFAIRNSQFLSFTRPQTLPQYPLSVIFGESLELTGYDLRFNRAEEVQVVTYWRALAPLPAEVAPVLYLMDSAGNLKGATEGRTLSPTMIWLPADQWPVGETIAVTFNKLNWDTRRQKAWRLGIGVSTDPDPWNVGARWQPAVQHSPFANHLMSDRTILELAQFKRVAGMSEGAPQQRKMQPPVVNHRLNVIFSAVGGQRSAVGPQVRLIGYNTPQIADNSLRLDLLWQGVGSERGDYIRFVHVVGADGQLLGQWDSPPVQGTYPTLLWRDGEFVWDGVEVSLDNNSPSGVYTLHIGLYDPLSGQRLLTLSEQDHVEISIQIDAQ